MDTMYLFNQPIIPEDIMDFKKYIIVENIPAFRNSLVDKSNVDSIPVAKSYIEYSTSKSGKKRFILSSSVKWSKVEGLKNVGVTGLYLAPFKHILGLNFCAFAGLCAGGCIGYTGRLGMFHQNTLEWKSLALYHHTIEFMLDVLRELYIQSFKASIDGKELWARLNGSTDCRFEKILRMDLIVQDFNGLAGFYDYTKYPFVSNPWTSYHLTFSYSETTKKIHPSFDRVAIVVTKKDKVKLLNDYPGVFCDGDQHDIRALDSHKWVLLQGKRATAKGKQLHNDFVQSYESVAAMCLEVTK